MKKEELEQENKEFERFIKMIEEEKGIKVLFAVENGSRAWGIESKNSDYDIRFVFVRPVEDYLSIDYKKEVIEYTSNDKMLDVVGFDIKKFTKLLYKSNPTCIEWINSPFIYYGRVPMALKWYTNIKYNKKSLYYHYKSLAKKNYEKYIKSGNNVTAKKYIYALRGILNADFIIKKGTLPCSSFEFTVNVMKGEGLPELEAREIKHLLKMKRQGLDKDIIDRNILLDEYIEFRIGMDAVIGDTRDLEQDQQSREELNDWVTNTVLNQ